MFSPFSSKNQFLSSAAKIAPREDFDRSVQHELLGATIFFVGLFLLAVLLFGENAEQYVGTIGIQLHATLVLLFGEIISYFFPFAIMTFGILFFFGQSIKTSFPKAVGMAFVLLSLCGLMAIPQADLLESRQNNLQLAGILGVFLTEYEGLQLVARFGRLGSSFVLSITLLLGLVLSTGLRISHMLQLLFFRYKDQATTQAFEPAEQMPVFAKESKRQTATKIEQHETMQHQAFQEEEHPAPLRPQPVLPRKRFAAGWFAKLNPFASKRAYTDGPHVLSSIQEPTDWIEPADKDVAAVARAIEVHELESRLKKRLRVESPGSRLFYERTMDEMDARERAELEQRLKAEAEALNEELEAEYGDQVIPEEQADEAEHEDEIIFNDYTAPKVNASNPNVGQELARMFPSRWPKEGVHVSEEQKVQEGNHPETAEEILEKSEERRMRQLRDAQAGAAPSFKLSPEQEDQENLDPSDPLFTANFDTRPHGPNGEAVQYTTDQPDFVDSIPNVYRLPDLDILADPPVVDTSMTREEVIEMSQKLVQTIADYGIEGKVTQVHQGPVVTLFEFKPAAGTKVSRIVGLEQDIAMGMKALSVRILAPIPGKNVVGIEVPNKVRQGVYLKELISNDEFWEATGNLEVAIGKTIDGKPFFADLAKMPHLLIAGATGAGKSVCLNTIICSLLYRQSPDKVKLIMVDPKRVELSVYADIPHLLAPVVCEAKRAAAALEWAVEQMENRYKLLVDYGVRNIDGYNALCANPEKSKKTIGRSLKPMPYMVIIVDELADLMIVAKADVEESIQRLAQMARAVGIHLILATQRPSVNVITGIIKANFPSRIAFQVSQKVDSRTILDSNGAEALLGRGDMLLSKGGAAKPIRIQGAFLSDDEVESIAEHCRKQQPVIYEVEEFEPKLSEKEQKELAKMMGVENFGDLESQDRMVNGTNKVMGKVTAGMFIPHEGGSASAGDDEIDEALVRAAARLILESRKASVSLLQRRLKVGFARAGRLMDMLEEMKIVGEFLGSKPREIIVDPEAALEQLDRLEASLAQGMGSEKIRAQDEADLEEYDDDEEVYEDDSAHSSRYE